MNMASALPSGKLTAGGAVALVVYIVVQLLNHYLLKADPIPDEITSLLPALGFFLGGYIKEPNSTDVAVVKEEK